METELRRYRKARGWTMREVSEMCGIQLANYANYESGKITSSLVTTKNIAKGLGLSMEKVYEMVQMKESTARAFPTIVAGWQDLLGLTDTQIINEIKTGSNIAMSSSNWATYKGGSGVHSIRNIGTCGRMAVIANYFKAKLQDAVGSMSDDQLRDIAANLKYGSVLLDWIDAGRPVTWEYIYDSIELAKRDLEIALNAANQPAINE